MSTLFRVKPLARSIGEMEHGDAAPQARARAGAAHLARHRRHHRRGHLLDRRAPRRPAAPTTSAPGPALVLSFVLVAVACGFAALCYAEFAAMVPVSGSAYTYAYATLGELIAWIIGWDLILEYAVGNVAVAISWSDYFQSLLAGFRLHVAALAGHRFPHRRCRRRTRSPRPRPRGVDSSTLGGAVARGRARDGRRAARARHSHHLQPAGRSSSWC